MYPAPKPTKKQKPVNTQLTIHEVHTVENLNEIRYQNWNSEYHQIVSIDPGIENFAIRIEKRYADGRKIPLLYERVKLETDLDETSSKIYTNCTNYLNQHIAHFLAANFIVMERQLPINYRCVRLSQHVISYFCLLLRNNPMYTFVMEIDSKAKGKILGVPPGLNKYQYKDWLIQKATTILTESGDTESLGKLLGERSNNKRKKKQDDLADTVCQIEACLKILRVLK